MAKHIIRPYEELVLANEAIRKVLANGAEERLRKIPGVRYVSVGLKAQAREVTNDLCIRVYVHLKKPDSELSADERIPKFIDGIPTDVNAPNGKLELLVDSRRYRPLKGGIEISNLIIDLDENSTVKYGLQDGTFGFTATRNSNGDPVLVSNCHVLLANGARKGEPIFQPSVADSEIPLYLPSQLPKRHDEDDNITIAHIIDGWMTDKVDVAIAKLDVSSCCRCCGLDFRDEIVGLSVAGAPPDNQIHGRRPAVGGQTVYKVGINGRTVGRVLDPTMDPKFKAHFRGNEYAFTGQIGIVNEDEDERFSEHGDSGSAIIDQDGYLVGLLFAGEDTDTGDIFRPLHVTYANQIADVLTAADITPNFKGGGTTAGAQMAARRVTFPMPLSPTGAELYAATRTRVESDPAGRWLWALAEEHREEIVTLVTTHRRVSVVWHRAGGPAIFAAALNSLRTGDQESLPSPPGGGTLEEAMARVGTALATHGSPALRTALARHRAALLGAARGASTLTALLDGLRPHVHAELQGQQAGGAPA
jgi:hypothetical protein